MALAASARAVGHNEGGASVSQVIYFETLRSGLMPDVGLRAPSAGRYCLNCRHWLVADGFGHCERLGGWHGPVQSGQRFVCDRWVKLRDEVVHA